MGNSGPIEDAIAITVVGGTIYFVLAYIYCMYIEDFIDEMRRKFNDWWYGGNEEDKK